MEIVIGIAGSCVIVPLLITDSPDNWNVAVPGMMSTWFPYASCSRRPSAVAVAAGAVLRGDTTAYIALHC